MREVIEIIVDILKLSDKLSNRRDKMSNARQEWMNAIRSREDRPTVNLPYSEYLKLVEAIGQCAMILDRSVAKYDNPDCTIQAVNDVDLIQAEYDDLVLTPEANRDTLDHILESDLAFQSLSDSLGLN